jgi:hypothetical protein
MISVNSLKRELLKNKLKAVDSVLDRIIVGHAFMKACYLNFTKMGYEVNKIFYAFFREEVEQILEIKLGREYTLLIRHFVRNFPHKTFLKMQNFS